MSDHALVTDASYKNALAVVRSLGRRKIPIVTASHYSLTLAGLSRFADAHIRLPNPAHQDHFTAALLDYCKAKRPAVTIPVGYLSSQAIASARDQLAECTRTVISPADTFAVAADKGRTVLAARECDITTPTVFNRPEDVTHFPVVVKNVRESGTVTYCNNAAELARCDTSAAIIQEYIAGDGYGYYALFRHGEPRAWFMSRRVREFPVTGGAATCAESVCDEDLRRQGERLLRKLNWHGVAMVEFKRRTTDGTFVLMEINPKFWGSLDLAIYAGVDFPYLLYRMALDGDIEPVTDYRIGARFHWPLPDEALHGLANTRALGGIIRDCFSGAVGSNLQLTDPAPAALQTALTARTLVKRLLSGTLRYPHGRIDRAC